MIPPSQDCYPPSDPRFQGAPINLKLDKALSPSSVLQNPLVPLVTPPTLTLLFARVDRSMHMQSLTHFSKLTGCQTIFLAKTRQFCSGTAPSATPCRQSAPLALSSCRTADDELLEQVLWKCMVLIQGHHFVAVKFQVKLLHVGCRILFF